MPEVHALWNYRFCWSTSHLNILPDIVHLERHNSQSLVTITTYCCWKKLKFNEIVQESIKQLFSISSFSSVSACYRKQLPTHKDCSIRTNYRKMSKAILHTTFMANTMKKKIEIRYILSLLASLRCFNWHIFHLKNLFIFLMSSTM